MIKRLFFLLMFIAFQVDAQMSSQAEWYRGELILNDNIALKGDVAYDMTHNVVQFQQKGQVRTFSANQVVYFSTDPERAGESKHFFSLPSIEPRHRGKNVFYELILHGKMSLLSREFPRYYAKNRRNADWRGVKESEKLNQPLSSKRFGVINYFYLADEDGTVTLVTKNRKKLLDRFGVHRDRIKKYVQDRMLTTYERDDLIQIVNHYNNLWSETSQVDR